MATGSQRYRRHDVWDTLKIKRDALHAAKYDDAATEQWRTDILEWLDEAAKSKMARQPALYLSALDDLSNALNSLTTGVNEFRNYVSNQQTNHPQYVGGLLAALRALPLPPPKELTASYIELLDQEVAARTTRLDELESKVRETETALDGRLQELKRISEEVEKLSKSIQTERDAISAVTSTAESTMDANWRDVLATWKQERRDADEKRNAEALEHVTALAATRQAAQVLAEHAAGDLSAADWSGRAKRERRAAQGIRFGAMAAFVFAGAIGLFIVSEAIDKNFDLTVGDGILRASVATVVAAFGALLLRESSRHFKEADTAEDVALSLQALAPFYANSDDTMRLEARQRVGDAVLVQNVLSRFANRDAAKHSGDIAAAELQSLVQDGTRALNPKTETE